MTSGTCGGSNGVSSPVDRSESHQDDTNTFDKTITQKIGRNEPRDKNDWTISLHQRAESVSHVCVCSHFKVKVSMQNFVSPVKNRTANT